MNEYDDLFDKEIDYNSSNYNSNKGIDKLYEDINLQKRNGILLMIYILSMILFTFLSQVYIDIKYPDKDMILDNITSVSDPTFGTYDNLDGTTLYTFRYFSIMKNETGIELPIVYVDILLTDDDNNSYTLTIEKENIADGETFFLGSTANIDFYPTHHEVNIGFDESHYFYVLIGLLPVMVSAIAFLIVDWKAFKYDALRFKKDFSNHIGTIVIGFIGVWTALVIASYILSFLGVTDTSENEMVIKSLFTPDTFQLILLFSLLCIFTPIAEEVIFRKVIYNFFESKTNYIGGIILSGSVFGLMHVISYGDFIQAIPYILMGMVFGYIYYKAKKNIFVTIGVHFINNFISFLVYALGAYGIYNI
ncbi:MAG: hypothetical protein B6I17_00230 [Tenericutes bacterium 4572_104]|nr:MAG: hypothetical protein B6I17_00230 [Tenericutes bacterium 4572_104]